MSTDRRRLPFNGRVALIGLRGQVAAETFVPGEPVSVARALTPLLRAPGGTMDTQLHFGAPLTVIERGAKVCFVQCETDGYVGYADTGALGPRATASHRVSARSTMFYDAPDFKSPVRGDLSFNARVVGAGSEGQFLKTPDGWIPAQHVSPLDARPSDWVALAEMFLGTPYLWGGTSGWGIDCSSLVQMALWAAGRTCPRDSDQQRAELGAPIDPANGLRRGDLVFWEGHVGLLTDPLTLLHANAHHMAVAREPLDRALTRIGAQEFGDVLAYKRL